MRIDLHRRRFLLNTLPAATAIAASPPSAWAQPVPESARILCGYPAGGSVDVVCRKLAQQLSGKWARTVVVENKPGAAGRVAVDALRTALPDGLSMLITPGSVVTMYPHIYRNLSYDVFGDLAPVSIVAMTAFALAVGPRVPLAVRTFADFINWCKSNPAAADCGNAGAGSFPHFMAMLVAREAGVALTHVPYRGGLPAMQAAAAGEVSATLATEGSASTLAQSGKVRVLATSGNDRSPFLPDAPTFRELGFVNLAQREWYAAFMPAKAPATTIAVVAEGIRAALREPDVRNVWQKVALGAESSTPAELQRALRTEYDFWSPIIRASGFTPEA